MVAGNSKRKEIGDENPGSTKKPRVTRGRPTESAAGGESPDNFVMENAFEELSDDEKGTPSTLPDDARATEETLPVVEAAVQEAQPSISAPPALSTGSDVQLGDIPRRPLLSEPLRRRLQGFINFASDKDNTYSVTKLPTDLTWGPSGGPNANNVCRAGSNIPVVVWHVGEVVKFWFFKQNGDPADNVSLTVDPLTSNAKTAVQAIARKFLDPRRRAALEQFSPEVKASKWQTARIPGERAAMAVPFDRVYDATSRYMRLSDMPTLDAAKIKTGDIVLLETGFPTARPRQDEGGDSNFDAVL
ncbi:hypothetical protein FA95DRAFT_1614037 [Auriscalpium vulgare]|uniref:Uncharacterized protein n=1 Tax=Auriscalpium vulgare TaxID=40419 RepID=A0ACB8R144_9AGAM|nr:hypothetical protein FA95DRAFT_1614037 [Auriscalpium vulgare]